MASGKKRQYDFIRGQISGILEAKKMVTRLCAYMLQENKAEYYKLISKLKIDDGNMKEEELKFWLRALGQNVSSIVELKCDELLNLFMFKCPWLVSSSTHYKCFHSFIQFCLRLFSHKALYIPTVLRHILTLFISLAQYVPPI